MSGNRVPPRLKILSVGKLLPRVMRTLKEKHDVADHTASATAETRSVLADLMLANIAAYEKG
jgi:lactate dehydrogenase-like 2-hydroxyacid dehydrogenase